MLLLLLRHSDGAGAGLRPAATRRRHAAPRRSPRPAARPRAASRRARRRSRALMRDAQDTQYHASCVAQRLAEAQVHVTLARDEMQRFEDPVVRIGDRAHARRRLTLIAERHGRGRARRAPLHRRRLSTISATKYEVGCSSAVQERRRRHHAVATAALPTRVRPPAALTRCAEGAAGVTCACSRARGRSWRSRSRDRSSARPRRPWRPPCSGPGGSARRRAARAP